LEQITLTYDAENRQTGISRSGESQWHGPVSVAGGRRTQKAAGVDAMMHLLQPPLC
jgi:hypothetical protein